MGSIVVRKLPEGVVRGLKARARRHGRSAEAEVRAILSEAVLPPDRVRLGSLLADIGAEAALTEAEAAEFAARDRADTAPVDLT